jgi:hypothetical protein
MWFIRQSSRIGKGKNIKEGTDFKTSYQIADLMNSQGFAWQAGRNRSGFSIID